MVSFKVSALSMGSGPSLKNFIPPVISFHNVTEVAPASQAEPNECVCPIPEPTKELSELLARERKGAYSRKTSRRRKIRPGRQKINGYIAFKLYYGHILPSLHQVQLARALSKIWATYDNQLIWDYFSEQYMRYERTTSFVEWLTSVPKSATPQLCMNSSAFCPDCTSQQEEFKPIVDFFLFDENIEWLDFMVPDLVPGSVESSENSQ